MSWSITHLLNALFSSACVYLIWRPRKLPKASNESIARAAHEVNRAYCKSIGDESHKPWDEAPQWQRDSAVNGVKFLIENPEAVPEDSHKNWAKEKLAAGWIYGPVKDEADKRHPRLVPYKRLPKKQRTKDDLFLATVRALAQ